ncbi:hypothetical protein ASG49_00380 [Marmoricola sp. Leaf446]|uniref:hypothetical protein n=1 Tax=Marmoricola sp. Leaf446 TaxID=1736379 RepID=UPI0006FF7A12|nr:hypothetical protein [Marmoricola sp. Leaf446]KQT93513.1 hypothetical protein ASG49_00380 [Marmoricola sp. Leaf446]
MPREHPPLWRRVFDDVERRVGEPLAHLTSSTEFQSATVKVGRLKRAVARPVHAVAGLGFHLVGVPTNAEVRRLRSELHAVQRELSAMRRSRAEAERHQEKQP